jgi:hypothetical protein
MTEFQLVLALATTLIINNNWSIGFKTICVGAESRNKQS